MPARADTPRDLLFGLFALHNGLIDQPALVLAFHAWTRAGGRPMAEILVEQGAVDADQRRLLEALAAQHLKKHGGDPAKSLAAIEVGASTRRKLTEVADPDLTASLAAVGVASTLDDPGATASYAAGTSASAGQRFRVLRPHARGGLGAVFVALDAELNREVALKEILEHHADNPAHRAKFVLEAEITGGLEHPGIVPVYGLGHHADGRPYYAMRFVKGDNLKQAIARFHGDEARAADPGARSLAFRELLRRFTDVCNAIEYAHSRGVLHRDIKPGNVIVGKHGETLVVDWGLAKARGHDPADPTSDERTLVPSSASGSVETLPGRALGTPAYMSPEQAAGDLGRLGPRSDVYSLGATLYSLLTGKAPFEGDLASVLRDVEEGRFARPRVVDPTIDPALEALCLKAMARLPEGRYPGPRALAEDLDRWSADEPVSAWKEPASRRARRWARRHRTGVTAASAALLMALVGLAGVLAVQSRANLALNEKNVELTRANGLVIRANLDLQAANEQVESRNSQLLRANEREARANADLQAANDQVQARFLLAQEAIRSFTGAVNLDEMLKENKLRPLRDKLLRSAAEFHGKLGLLLQGRPDRPSRVALGKSYFELGDLTNSIGDQEAALEVHRKALAVRRGLAEAEPDPADLQVDLASSLGAIGLILGDTGEPAEALVSHREALAIRTRLAEADRDSADRQGDLARSYNNIAYLLSRVGEPTKALESQGRGVEIVRRLAEANPAVPRFRADLATALGLMGDLLDRAGEPAEALKLHREALAISRRLAEADPAVAKYQSDLFVQHNNIAVLLDRAGEPAEALKSYREAMDVARRLADANPAVTKYQLDLAICLDNISEPLFRAGDKAGAREALVRALDVLRRIVEANPAVTDHRSALAMSHNDFGRFLEITGEPALAMESHVEALKIRRRLVDANPTVVEFQYELAQSHNNIGALLDRTGKSAEALGPFVEALAIRRRIAEANPTNTKYQAVLGNSHNNLGLLLKRVGDPARTLGSFGEAVKVRRRLVEANSTNRNFRAGLSESLMEFGMAADLLGRAAEAVANLREGLDLGGPLADGPVALVELACYQARLAGAASRPGSGLPAAEARAQADRAMAMLRRAVEAGFRDVGQIRSSKNLDPIRDRADFQGLVMDLAFPDRPYSP